LLNGKDENVYYCKSKSHSWNTSFQEYKENQRTNNNNKKVILRMIIQRIETKVKQYKRKTPLSRLDNNI
jgi:hypothetical protein